MAKVISFVSRKGGTGKTTNAINIATALTEMGKHVVVIETDINYTLSVLRKRERKRLREGKLIPDLVRTEETSVVKMIKTFRNDGVTDYVIVDTAAGNTTSYCTNRLCVASDMVIVPTSLSINDVLVTEETLKEILPAKKENPALKVFLLPNRIHSLTSDETIRNALAHLNAPVLNVFIPNKKTFTYTSTVRPAEGYAAVVNKILNLLEPESEQVEILNPEDSRLAEPVNEEHTPELEIYNTEGVPVIESVHHDLTDDSEAASEESIQQEEPVQRQFRQD